MTTTTHGPSIIFTTKLEKNVTQWAPIYWTEDLDRTPTTLGRDPIKLPSDLSRDPVHVWVDALKKLALTDPTEASELLPRVSEIQQRGNQLAIESDADTLAQDLASGPVDWSTLRDKAREVALSQLVEDKIAGTVRQITRSAALKAYLQARSQLRAAGDAVLVGGVLAPEAQRIIATASKKGADFEALQERWNIVTETARSLRMSVLTQVGATDWDHTFARPDLVHEWRLNHAPTVYACDRRRRLDAHNVAHVHLTMKRDDAPAVDLRTIVKHQQEWRPSIYTGPEVLANLEHWNT